MLNRPCIEEKKRRKEEEDSRRWTKGQTDGDRNRNETLIIHRLERERATLEHGELQKKKKKVKT